MNRDKRPLISPKRLSNSACTHCRTRKKRCSKELPKCSNCAPWPGPCIYTSSRRGQEESSSLNGAEQNSRRRAMQASRQSQLPSTSDQGVQGGVRGGELRASQGEPSETRQHIEMPDNNHRPVQLDIADSQRGESSTRGNAGNAGNAESYFNPSHSFPVLQSTTSSIPDVRTTVSGLAANESSIGSVMDSLRAAFANVDVEDTEDSSQNLFYLPRPETIDSLAATAHEVLTRGRIIISVPDIRTIRAILIHPFHSEDTGDVLLVNHILHSLSAASYPGSPASKAFLFNVQSALNRSIFFLNPSEDKLQALFMLATHGEGTYALPSMSWMLVGQACMQAKATELHKDFPVYSRRHWPRQQRLALFWSLFAVDKSVSLAFGRPEFLDTTYYRNLELPDAEYLNQYRPHTQRPREDIGSRGNFGGRFFLVTIAMAKLTSRYNSIVRGKEQAGMYCQELDSWCTAAMEDLEMESQQEEPCTDMEKDEMLLGIQAFRFQYLHLRCLALKNIARDMNMCFETARRALRLLPTLTSSSSNVYNGVIWQLIYYPFTLFLLLFEGMIVHRPQPRASVDLELMEITHDYYVAMGEILTAMREDTQILAECTRKCRNIAKLLAGAVTASPLPRFEIVDTALQILSQITNHDFHSGVELAAGDLRAAAVWDEGGDGPALPSAGMQWPEPDSFKDMDWFLWEVEDLFDD